MIHEGWAEIVPTWSQAVQQFGPEARLTPVACIIKQSHGKEKVRLVVDMEKFRKWPHDRKGTGRIAKSQ